MLINFGELIYLLTSFITILFFCLALKKQIEIKHKYHNGYMNHRKAFIGSTTMLTLITISRLIIGSTNYTDVMKYEVWQYINFWIITSGLFIVSVFNYMWFKGSDFKFLGSYRVKNYLINLFKIK
jgi:hypothetical protein